MTSWRRQEKEGLKEDPPPHHQGGVITILQKARFIFGNQLLSGSRLDISYVLLEKCECCWLFVVPQLEKEAD